MHSQKSYSALAHIARGSPLQQTLMCLIDTIQQVAASVKPVIFLVDTAALRLRLAANASISTQQQKAIEHFASSHFASNGFATQMEGKDWLDFCALPDQTQLLVHAAELILDASNQVLGIIVCYKEIEATTTSTPHVLLQQALTEAALFAAIAIEREQTCGLLQKTEDALLDHTAIMALAIEGSGTGIWDRDVVNGKIAYSCGWKTMLGYGESELSKQIEDSYARVHPDDLATVQTAMQAHFDQKIDHYAVEHRIRCKDGSYKWISSRGKVIMRDAQGQALRMVGTSSDITVMRTLSEQLQHSVDLITSLTNEVPGLVYQYRLPPNGNGQFSYASEGMDDMYELTVAQAMGNAALIHQIIHPDDLQDYLISLDTSAEMLTPWHLEYRVVLPKQGLRWRQGDAQPRKLEDGSILWHGFITDITERKRIEIELQEFATIDYLTQLPNRRYFMTRMGEELARLQRIKGSCAAVLMCDIDHFKKINDRHGHAVGDLVLKHFAVILRKALRKHDTVGRVGGEEFAIVLANAGITEAEVFSRRVHEQLKAMPLMVGDIAISITVSIGITCMRTEDAAADMSLSRSDMALYRAKKKGRNRTEIDVEIDIEKNS